MGDEELEFNYVIVCVFSETPHVGVQKASRSAALELRKILRIQ